MLHGATVVIRARAPGRCLEHASENSFKFSLGDTGILISLPDDSTNPAVVWDQDSSRTIRRVFSDALEIIGLDFAGKRFTVT